MKTSTNKNKRLEIRIAEEDLKYLKVASHLMGLKPSQLVRIFVDTTVNALKIKIRKGEINFEDIQAILND